MCSGPPVVSHSGWSWSWRACTSCSCQSYRVPCHWCASTFHARSTAPDTETTDSHITYTQYVQQCRTQRLQTVILHTHSTFNSAGHRDYRQSYYIHTVRSTAPDTETTHSHITYTQYVQQRRTQRLQTVILHTHSRPTFNSAGHRDYRQSYYIHTVHLQPKLHVYCT